MHSKDKEDLNTFSNVNFETNEIFESLQKSEDAFVANTSFEILKGRASNTLHSTKYLNRLLLYNLLMVLFIPISTIFTMFKRFG